MTKLRVAGTELVEEMPEAVGKIYDLYRDTPALSLIEYGRQLALVRGKTPQEDLSTVAYCGLCLCLGLLKRMIETGELEVIEDEL